MPQNKVNFTCDNPGNKTAHKDAEEEANTGNTFRLQFVREEATPAANGNNFSFNFKFNFGGAGSFVQR